MSAGDDRPLGGKGNYEIPESELPETQVEEVKGPLESRVESKVWKTRTEAFTELAELFRSAPDPPFDQFVPNFPKYLGDAHPGAQEQVMDAFAAVLGKRPEMLIAMAPDCVRALVEKGLTSAKTTNKAAAGNVLLLLFESFSSGFEVFAEALISTLENKNVKVQAAGVFAVTLVLKDFGPVNFQLKMFLTPMERLAASTNPAVRTEVMNFFKEAYRWIREAIKPTIDRLKKAQIEELMKSFEEITEFPQPVRLNKGQKLAPASSSRGPQIDAYDLAEAKDIFGKYNGNWVDGVLAMEKWVEKKEALEELNREADTPKLAERSPQELVTLVKRLLVDNNMNVQLQAIKLAGLLARGQRRYFEPFAKQLFPALLLKLKDKKGPVVQETQTALDNMLKSADFEDFLEDVSKILEDKAAHAKINAANLIDRISVTLPAKVKGRIGRDLAVMIKKNVNDSSADVRDSMLKSLALLKAKVSAEAVLAVVGDLPPAKLQKLNEIAQGLGEEAAEEQVVEVVASPAPPSRPRKAELIIVEEEVKEVPVGQKPPPKPKPPPKRPPAKSEESKATPAASKSNPAASKSNPAASATEEDAGAAVTPEEAEQRLTGLVPDGIMTGLNQAGWKDKQAALQELNAWIVENVDRATEQSEALARHVRVKCKDWKENNFNVVKAAFETFLVLTQHCSLTKRGAAMVLNAAALDKLSDGKVVDTYLQVMSAISESLSPRFVSGMIVKGTGDSGKPKVIVESCGALSKLLVEFGAHTLNVKDVIDYGKNCINNTNPTIKKAGQGLLVILYSFMGDAITALLTDIKEATMKVLQAEFATTEIRQNASFKAVKGEEQKAVDPRKALDDAIPRNNISNQITSKLLAALTDSNWKTRKETMDAIDGILTASGMRILPTGLNDVIKGLKGRLADPNKSLCRQSMALVGRFAEALGSECRQFNKFLVPGLLGNLADKQSLLRQDAIAAIDKWAKEAGPEAIIQYSAATLQQENPELRSELINWLLAHKDNLRNCEMEPFLPALLMCLQDRVAGIRNGGELLFAEVIAIVGFDAVTPHLKDIKPAIVNTLKPIIDKYRTQAAAEDLPPMPTPSKKELRPGTTKVVKASSTRSLMDPAQDQPAAPRSKSANVSEDISLLSSGKKDRRIEQEMRCKWSVEELRLDYVERMNEQLRTCVSSDLFTKMSSPDFKKQVEALSHLTAFLSSELSMFIECADVIIKWIFVKMMDTTINTQVMKGILELSAAMIAAFEEDQYRLHQVEVELFLMIMCDKSGHNNATFRTQIRGIMHNCTKVADPGKVFNCVLQGVNSKNNRSKVECLEELGALVLDFGISVYQPRDIKAIAKFVSHTDGGVRLAAVGAVAEVYKYLEDRVWALIGEVNDKAKEMLEQRFRMLNGGSSLSKTTPPKSNKADVSTPRRPTKQPEAARTFTESSEEEIPPKPPSHDSKIPDVEYHPEELGRPDTLLYQDFDKLIPDMEPVRPNVLTAHIHTLLNEDMSAQVDSLVYINDELLPKVEIYLEDFREKGSYFLEAVTKVMVQTFAKPAAEVQIRFAKYFLSVVHRVCSSKQIMAYLDEKTLYMLSEQVLRDLLIEDLDKLGERGEGELMLKTLNGTMLRILENCQVTLVFVVLIRLLTRYRNDQSVPKMPGLIIRCLLKLTKILGNLKADLEVSRLLLAMHEYLIEHRGTTAADDIGIKTIRTILNELVKLEGERIWGAYEAVRRHNTPDESIERWIRAINSTLSPVPPVSYQRLRSPPRATGLPQELLDISAKLKAAETYDDGIRLLFGYTERNPGTALTFLPVELQRKIDEDIQRLRARALETRAPSRFSLEAARAEARTEIPARPAELPRSVESPRPVVEPARSSPALPASQPQHAPNLSTPPRAGNENQEPESSAPFRIQDFQDRLAMMKRRYGLVNSGDTVPPTANVDDLRNRVNSLADVRSRLGGLKK